MYSTATLELAQHAKVKGNVYYKLLEMEVGAEVNGSLIHQSATTSKTKEQAASDKQSSKDRSAAPSSSDEVNLTTGNS